MRGTFRGPSGRELGPRDLTILELLFRIGSITREEVPVTLSGGSVSHFYARLRKELGKDPPVSLMLGEYLADFVRKLPTLCGPQYNLIGIPNAGRPLAQAASLADASRRPFTPVICFTDMRSELKEGHGVDGSMWAGIPELDHYTYCTVENASTTGKEVDRSLRRLEGDGFPTRTGMHHIVIFNRGGVEMLGQSGYEHVHGVFDLHDAIAAYANFELLPRTHLEEYREEIGWAA